MFKTLYQTGLLLSVFLLTAFAANAQFRATGIVTDADSGDPLIGVTVAVKGGNGGTVTDITGRSPYKSPSARQRWSCRTPATRP